MLQFKRLIEKHSVSFMIEYASQTTGEPTAADYDDLGKYIGNVQYESPAQEQGALIPLPQRVIYQSGGRLTEADRMLYSLNHDIPPKSKIAYEGFTYHVESKTPYKEFADFSQYTLKAVSNS